MRHLAGTMRSGEFLPLPTERTVKGEERLTGVEMEFGGLDEAQAAELVVACFGGRSLVRGANAITVEGTALGTFRVVLDTAFREKNPSPLKAAVLDAARRVVPVEIVTDPLTRAQLEELERLREALRQAGATGSRSGALLGFGLHLNPEVPDLSAEAIIPVLRAYALLEDWLRGDDPIDLSRRLLPFVDPYPRRFVDRLAGDGGDWTLDRAIDVYLEDTPSRNRGLDMLPLFREIDEARVLRGIGEGARSIHPRPTFHFRLPDCRVDEAGWRISHEWNRWRLVEVVAADAELLKRLAQDWLRHRQVFGSHVGDWRDRVDEILSGVDDRAPAA